MCKKTIIAQGNNITITQCVNCKVVNIWNSALLMRFTFAQFDEFAKIATRIEFDDYLEHAPDGTEIVILSTPCNDICLMFTRDELQNFSNTIDEAIYMQNVYRLVHE
ncbi:MAG: hypothetical protein EOP00_19160 [Pedobacter sp.]|nr:MAG: hypothetical protein EOP00_19160 [Pedobacter sp.]